MKYKKQFQMLEFKPCIIWSIRTCVFCFQFSIFFPDIDFDFPNIPLTGGVRQFCKYRAPLRHRYSMYQLPNKKVATFKTYISDDKVVHITSA